MQKEEIHYTAKGGDPLHPYAFVVAEATRRKIDVEKTSPGATMLNGGRATLISDAALILHENVGTSFERAFLVAHQIGRVELGDDFDAEPILNVDPRRILLLTFSNKAAEEMADRIALKDKNAAAAMWSGTFHAFGLDVIRRFHIELDLPQDPHLRDRTEAVELLEQEFPHLDLVHYRNLYDLTQNIANILSLPTAATVPHKTENRCSSPIMPSMHDIERGSHASKVTA